MLRAAPPLVLALSLGCASATAGDGDAWKQALESADSAVGVFSFQFVSAPPEGALFRIHLHPAQMLDACSLYDPFAHGTPLDGTWLVVATIGSTEAGEYNLVPPSAFDETDRENSASQATLYVGRADNGETPSKFWAIDGTVVVAQGPTAPSEWNSSSVLTASVVARFAESPWAEQYCDSVVGPEGTESSVCYCESASGQVASCDAIDDYDCCSSLGNESTVDFQFGITSAPCKWLCSAISDDLFGEYCLPLEP